MPELPEVETVARQLAPYVEGRVLRRVEILDPRLRDDAVAALADRPVRDVRRVGKQVALQLSPVPGLAPPEWLLIHLRMTGRLLAGDGPPPDDRRHLRALLWLDRGHVRFVDPRRFGTMHTVVGARPPRASGLDPLSRACTARRLGALLAGSPTPLKVWLLRQDRLVGLGNIYASEALFAAGLSPTRPAGSLADHEVARLHRHLRRILRRAIDACGTTFSDFQGAQGVTGSYQRYLAVYGRTGQPCPRCGTAVERATLQQRSTFWCPRCQA